MLKRTVFVTLVLSLTLCKVQAMDRAIPVSVPILSYYEYVAVASYVDF